MTRRLATAALVVCFVGCVEAGAGTLRVCTTLELGFSMRKEGDTATTLPVENITSDSQLTGFDCDMRALILGPNHLNLPYELRVYASFGEAMVRTRNGECDIGWAPYYITAKRDSCTINDDCLALDPGWMTNSTETKYDGVPITPLVANAGALLPDHDWEPYRCCVDFSQQYVLPSDDAIVYRRRSVSMMDAIGEALRANFFINFAAFFFTLIILMGHVVWLVERYINPEQFPRAYMDGVDDGIWWSAVTVTTVGYGDKFTVSPLGKVVALFWMFAGVTLCGIFTGYLSQAIFEARHNSIAITSVRDLVGMRVCAYPGTTLPHGMTKVPADGVDACAPMLQSGEVDAIYMDGPILAYWWTHTPWALADDNLHFYDDVLAPPLCLTFTEGAVCGAGTLVADINLAIQRVAASPGYTSMMEQYFEASSTSSSFGDEEIAWPWVFSSLGFFACYITAQIFMLVKAVRNETKRRLKKEAEERDGLPTNKLARGTSVAANIRKATSLAAKGAALGTSAPTESESLPPEQNGFTPWPAERSGGEMVAMASADSSRMAEVERKLDLLLARAAETGDLKAPAAVS